MTQTGGRYPGWRPGIELRDDWLGLVPETAIDRKYRCSLGSECFIDCKYQ